MKTTDDTPSFPDEIVRLFKSNEEVCINLETTVGAGGRKREKAHTFQTPKEKLAEASECGVSIFNIANNHSFDYYDEGLNKTLFYLDEIGKRTIGKKTSPYVFVESDGLTVGLSAYQNGSQYGIAAIDEEAIYEDISRMKQKADKIVICLHWGDEYVAYPSPYQQQIARNIVDAGADLIIGHHPHVMQGIEHYHNAVIYYSLGNFNLCVDHPYSKKLNTTRYGYCVLVNFSNIEGAEVLPIRIDDNYQPHLLNGEKKDAVKDYLERISDKLKGAGVSRLFYLIRVSPCLLHNYMPAWRMRIMNYGWPHFKEFIKWALSPKTWKYYIGYMLSFFVRREKLYLQ